MISSSERYMKIGRAIKSMFSVQPCHIRPSQPMFWSKIEYICLWLFRPRTQLYSVAEHMTELMHLYDEIMMSFTGILIIYIPAYVVALLVGIAIK